MWTWRMGRPPLRAPGSGPTESDTASRECQDVLSFCRGSAKWRNFDTLCCRHASPWRLATVNSAAPVPLAPPPHAGRYKVAQRLQLSGTSCCSRVIVCHRVKANTVLLLATTSQLEIVLWRSPSPGEVNQCRPVETTSLPLHEIDRCLLELV